MTAVAATVRPSLLLLESAAAPAFASARWGCRHGGRGERPAAVVLAASNPITYIIDKFLGRPDVETVVRKKLVELSAAAHVSAESDIEALSSARSAVASNIVALNDAVAASLTARGEAMQAAEQGWEVPEVVWPTALEAVAAKVASKMAAVHAATKALEEQRDLLVAAVAAAELGAKNRSLSFVAAFQDVELEEEAKARLAVEFAETNVTRPVKEGMLLRRWAFAKATVTDAKRSLRLVAELSPVDTAELVVTLTNARRGRKEKELEARKQLEEAAPAAKPPAVEVAGGSATSEDEGGGSPFFLVALGALLLLGGVVASNGNLPVSVPMPSVPASLPAPFAISLPAPFATGVPATSTKVTPLVSTIPQSKELVAKPVEKGELLELLK